MGTLILPASGMIYADAQIAIYSSDSHPRYAAVCAPVWQVSGTTSVVSSELILLEILVSPLRSGDTLLAAHREALWRQSNTRLLPLLRTSYAKLPACVP